MWKWTWAAAGLSVSLWMAGSFSGITAQIPVPGTLPGVEPLHESGQDVTPAFEGWFKNADGTIEILFGYNNRNLKEELDIPIGPNNKIEPMGPDAGQPTHFNPRRGWGVFTVKVPADFGTKKLTWTLAAAGRTNSIPAGLDSRWEIDALNEVTSGNTPPVIRFGPSAPTNQGPRTFYGPPASGNVGRPVALDVYATDDNKNRSRNPRGPRLTVTWSKYRGPGDVKFEKAKPEIDGESGKASTTATFSEAGDYIVRVVANDSSGDGGGGFQCCWTNGLVKVSVKP
jgi:hypothetical protein